MFLFHYLDGILWHPHFHEIRSACLIWPSAWSCLLPFVSNLLQQPSNVFFASGQQEIRLLWMWRLRAVLLVSSRRPERQADKLQVEQGDMPGRESGTEPQHRYTVMIWILVWIEQDWNKTHCICWLFQKHHISLWKPASRLRYRQRECERLHCVWLCSWVNGPELNARIETPGFHSKLHKSSLLNETNQICEIWNMLFFYTYVSLSLCYISFFFPATFVLCTLIDSYHEYSQLQNYWRPSGKWHYTGWYFPVGEDYLLSVWLSKLHSAKDSSQYLPSIHF